MCDLALAALAIDKSKRKDSHVQALFNITRCGSEPNRQTLIPIPSPPPILESGTRCFSGVYCNLASKP